jgi:hypothetical protein
MASLKSDSIKFLILPFSKFDVGVKVCSTHHPQVCRASLILHDIGPSGNAQGMNESVGHNKKSFFYFL